MSASGMSILFLLIGAFLWIIFCLFLNGKSYYKNVLAGIMLISVVFVFIPLPTNLKNYMVYPLLGGFFVGELILGWIRKIKRKFISESEEKEAKKPSKLSRKEKVDNENSKNQVIVSDEELSKRKRVKKRYDEK